jgi:predicted nucleic acid-binding protein
LSVREVSLGLLDTSVFIATENGRPLRLEGLPERSFISIVTKAELRAGVLAADDVETRDRRLDTLERVAGLTMIPVGDGVDRIWAGMRAYLRAAGQRINANDLWIAAPATAHEMPVFTQDRDFGALSGVNGLTVVQV